jgi:hypothetical protein
MARIKKYSPQQNLTSFQTFVVDDNPNSDYFRITEFKDTFTGGKNGFLIEGSEHLKESTEIKIEILDVNGDPIYYEPGNGIPEYYEGISKLIAVYVYEDTPIGLGKITILGELKQYDDNGVIRQIPSEWSGAYNVKWERTFQINKNLSNEDRVRFYRRPQVGIDEIVKPIFNKTPQTVTQTGQVDGLPLIPIENTQLSNFSLPTSYRLRVTDETYWTGSAVGQTIQFGGLNYSPIITDIVNKGEVLVSPPYTESDLVKGFSSQNYSVSFPYIEGAIDLATALTGSFAKINITNMKTFVGDAARVKVFRKSVSQLTDYEFVQEIQLESNELLRDLESVESTEVFYGNLNQDYLTNYWLTSSNDLTTTFNQDFLYNSVELDNGVTTPQYFFTSQSLNVTKDVEYNLSFNVRKRTNTSTDDYLKVYLSGSFGSIPTTQPITTINSSNGVLQKTTINQNIIANDISGSQLYFEVLGDDWLINNVSFRAAEETAFSPDEITFIQSVPKTLAEETFDFRFEFYDINNNYIPVLVEETKTFTGGNLNLFNKELTLTPNQLYFTFDSASSPANPLPPLNIFIDVEKRVITGSVTFTSGAYDEFGNLLSSSQYVGGIFPGLLTDRDKDIVKLNVSDFTGSRDDITVQYIEYTGEVEGVTDSFVISRVQDGKGGVNFEIRPYRGTIIKNKDDKELEVQAIRIDGINEIKLKSNLPQTGFSDAKLRVLSSSIDEITSEESGSYILLSEASSSKFIRGLNAGLTGSGEIDYNARFNRDSIDNELTLFLMDNATSESILTSIILTDLQDGLDSGFVTFDADVFTINPRTQTQFTPTYSSVTGSFYKRGTKANPVSASLEIFPSMSINADFVPEYWMYFVSHSKDETIQVTAYDEFGSLIPHGEVGSYIGLPVSQSKQLLVNFTYTEPITSASVQVDHIFTIVPEGKPGDETVLFEVNPQVVTLNGNSRGVINDYSPSITDISLRQGSRRLIFTGSKEPGTFTIASESISTKNIEAGLIHFTSSFGTDYTSSLIVSESANLSQLSGSITYPLEIRPYFTSSVYTQSFVQNYTKVLDGPPPIEINLVPQSVTLIADEVEYISDYSNANTKITVKEGTDSLIYTGSGLPGTFTLESVEANNITSNITAIEGGFTASVEFSDFDYPYVSASATYNINVYPYSLGPGHRFTSSVYERTQNFVKSTTPAKARSVELSATSTVVKFDGDGLITSPQGSIILTATAYNTTGSVYYGFFRDGYTWQPYSQTNTLTIASGDATEENNTVSWEVKIKDGGSTADVFATDNVTITGVSDGSDNYQVQIDNPAVTLTVEVDGTTTFTNSGATVRATKGSGSLTHVTSYSPSDYVYNDQGVFIGNLGQYSASVHYVDTFLTQTDTFSGNPASIGNISGWTTPQTNPSATIVYKVDIENGRATYFVSQSFAASFEGATGPGLVMRGEWTGSIDYLFDLEAKRRDSVFREIGGDVHYWATTEDLADAGSPPYTYEPDYTGPPSEGDIDSNGWQYLGMQDFFVAAKLAIFEESFVKNTINVGIPPDGNPNANIAIVGGTDEPYIAIGQSGTQGYAQPGVFLGLTNDGGPSGTSGTMGLMSLSGVPDGGGSYNSLEWDGEVLTIRGAIKQTSAGQIEPALRGVWQDATNYNENDLVVYNGQSWTADSAHTSDIAGGVTDGPPGTGPWTSASGTGKTVSLSADTFVIEYDQDGNNPSPSSINLVASSSNFVDAYFKFTGGGSFFTDETTFTNGADGDNDIVSSIDMSSTTISDMPLQFRVGVADGGLSGQDQVELISDVINVFGIKPGADTTPQYMITPLTGTQLKNSGGSIELQVQESSVSGLSDVTSGWPQIYKSDSSLLHTSMSGISDGGNGAVYNPILDSDAINGTLNLQLRDVSDNVLDSITLVDVTDGLGGGSFISPNLKSTRSPIDNSFTPTLLHATASFYDTSGTEYQGRVTITPSFSGGVDNMAVSTKTGDSEVVITAGDGDGGSVTLGGSSVATKDIVLTAVFTDPATGQKTTINETFYIISDGADGLDAITVINTNQSHTLPADSSGNVTSFTDSGTTIIIYEGTTKLDYDGTGTADGTYTVSIPPVSGVTIGAASADGNDDLGIGDHTGMTPATAVISYNISGTRTNGDSFTTQTTQTLTKANAGTDGTDGTDGEAAGVTYAGEWRAPGTVTYDDYEPYQGEATLKYVVKYTSDYYICARTHTYRGVYDSGNQYEDNDVARYLGVYYIVKVGQGPVTGVTPSVSSPGNIYWEQIGASITPGVWTDGWESFGAQFTSVATDILFAQDVYANRTINIGSDASASAVIAINADSASGYQNPYISIGQSSTPGFGEDGIYLGYTEQTASFSLLSQNGARVNIGGLRVDREGLYYEGNRVIGQTANPNSTIVITNDGTSNFTFEPEMDGGTLSGAGITEQRITSYVDSTTLVGNSAQYNLAISLWSISYVSGAYETPVGGPTAPQSYLYEQHSWRSDFAQAPEPAANETWFVDWSIDKNTTLTSYDLTYSSPGIGYNALVLRTGTIASEFSITDTDINNLKGDGLPFPPAGGSTDVDTDVYYEPTGSLPILYIESAEDGDQNYTWAESARVGYQILDVVNSSNVVSTTGYDTFILGKRVDNETYNFGDDFQTFESTYGVGAAANGTAPAGASPSIQESLFRNLQLFWTTPLSISGVSTGGGVLSMGSLDNITEPSEFLRLHSSGSNGNSRPYLSMGQATQSFDEEGIFLGFISGSDEGMLSLKSNTNSLLWDGGALTINGEINGGGLREGATLEGSAIYVPSQTAPSFSVDTDGNVTAESATIRGTIQATDGNIGDWVIDANDQTLRDDNSEIIFDPNIPEVGLYTAASKTVRLSPTGGLTSVTSTGTSFTGLPSTPPSPSTATSNAGNSTIVYSSAVSAQSNATPVADIPDGTYPIAFTIPAVTLSSTAIATADTTTAYPNYLGTYDGQIHGSTFSSRGQRSYTLYTELGYEDTSVYIFDDAYTQFLFSLTAYGKYEYSDVYVWYSGFISVTGDTPIRLWNGSTKNAEDIDGDDLLLVWDEKNDRLVPSQLGGVLHRQVDKYFLVETETESVKVSDTHAFYLEGNVEKPVNDLIAGTDRVFVYKDGKLVKETVINVSEINSTVDVYTFRVPNYENYISSNILSHNPVQGNWEASTNYQLFSNVDGTKSSNTIIRNFTFDKGSSTTGYKLRYKARFGARSAFAYDTPAAGGTPTTVYFQVTTSTSDVSSYSLPTSVTVDIPSNITEITGKGIQVLSGQNEYVRIERSNFNKKLIQAAGGDFIFGSEDVGQTTEYSIIPGLDNTHTLGTNTNGWKNLFVSSGGTITLGTSGTDYSQALNGWTFLTNGILIQWGYVYGTSATVTITFPLEFPSQCRSVQVATDRSSSGSNGYNHVDAMTTTTATVILDSPYDGWWMAIGY